MGDVAYFFRYETSNSGRQKGTSEMAEEMSYAVSATTLSP